MIGVMETCDTEIYSRAKHVVQGNALKPDTIIRWWRVLVRDA